jgi:hypothetical protein
MLDRSSPRVSAGHRSSAFPTTSPLWMPAVPDCTRAYGWRVAREYRYLDPQGVHFSGLRHGHARSGEDGPIGLRRRRRGLRAHRLLLEFELAQPFNKAFVLDLVLLDRTQASSPAHPSADDEAHSSVYLAVQPCPTPTPLLTGCGQGASEGRSRPERALSKRPYPLAVGAPMWRDSPNQVPRIRLTFRHGWQRFAHCVPAGTENTSLYQPDGM